MKNGNKGMAVVLTAVFMHLNGYFPFTTPMKLYDLAKEVSKSKPEDRDNAIKALTNVFEEIMITNEEFDRRTADVEDEPDLKKAA